MTTPTEPLIEITIAVPLKDWRTTVRQILPSVTPDTTIKVPTRTLQQMIQQHAMHIGQRVKVEIASK